MSERQVHRCAVIVFCEAEGADEADAGRNAALALSHALHGGGLGEVGHAAFTKENEARDPTIGFDMRNGIQVRATVRDLMEAGMAIGNGYLWTRVTSKAFPR